MAASALKFRNKIRVISLDVTGTLIRHRDPIMETYSRAMHYSFFPKPLSPEQLGPAFKAAYKKTLTEYPYFGAAAGKSSKQWWIVCVRRCLKEAGLEVDRDYSQAEFDRFFRRVYQHYGCPEGYAPMDDAKPFLDWCASRGYLLGVTTNTPSRTMESVLPFMGLHHHLRFFVCSQDCASEKPERGIFEKADKEIQSAAGNILRNGGCNATSSGSHENIPASSYARLLAGGEKIDRSEVLHIGDSLAADLCGARQFGWEALHLDRSKDPNVRVYQDWLTAPEYDGKSEEDVNRRTVTNFQQVRELLER